VEVVTVVPPDDEPEVVDGREGGSSRADDATHVVTKDLEPRGVTSLRALIGGQPDVSLGPERVDERPVDPVEVTLVRHDDEHTAAGVEGHPGSLGHQSRPVSLGGLTRKGEQRGGGVPPIGQPPQEGRTGRVCRPGR